MSCWFSNGEIKIKQMHQRSCIIMFIRGSLYRNSLTTQANPRSVTGAVYGSGWQSRVFHTLLIIQRNCFNLALKFPRLLFYDEIFKMSNLVPCLHSSSVLSYRTDAAKSSWNTVRAFRGIPICGNSLATLVCVFFIEEGVLSSGNDFSKASKANTV